MPAHDAGASWPWCAHTQACHAKLKGATTFRNPVHAMVYHYFMLDASTEHDGLQFIKDYALHPGIFLRQYECHRDEVSGGSVRRNAGKL